MQLSSEYLPATEAARQELVLLHGWGSDREIWRALLSHLRPWANVTLVDLPGCAADGRRVAASELPEILQAVLDCRAGAAVYLGWSLGGQLALELAGRYPDRVLAVVTVCTSPRFVADGSWPGMDRADFIKFRASFEAAPTAALQRFDSLQAGGSPRRRSLARQLQTLRRGRSGPGLRAGLQWLENLDQRTLLADLAQPQLHLLGANDGLVPVALRPVLTNHLASRPAARVETLADTGHVAPLESPGQVARELSRFLADSALLHQAPVAEAVVAKADVANSFSRSASLYDSVATLQRDVGSRLLTRLDQARVEPDTVLDLGCGTGFFYPELRRRFPRAHYVGLDLARGMVEFARGRFPQAGTWLVGDAEGLPLASNSIDLVFSSLAFQWCYRPRHLFAELARVLKPGGCCVFTSLGPDTLRELRAAWAAVDAGQHVNTFIPAADLRAAVTALPGVRLALQAEFYRMQYPRVRDLLTELKTLGAHNMHKERKVGLTGRRALQGMLEAYEGWRDDGLLPATYDVLYGTLEKP